MAIQLCPFAPAPAGHEITRPTDLCVCLPQKLFQRVFSQTWMPSRNFRCYGWKIAKGPTEQQETRMDTRWDATLMPPCWWWLKSVSPQLRGRSGSTEFTAGDGAASSEGTRILGNMQKAFRGPPPKIPSGNFS